ncbi:nicotinate-nucleotide adenylyltransferase [Bacillaceae bacterium S4-13-58]
MKKVGILGGTFDPPHLGHYIIAKEVLIQLQLDEIWFMPTYQPPHKENSNTSPDLRKQMVTIMANLDQRFRVESIELERKGISYSYETLTILRNQHPDIEFYFIIGGDMVDYLPKWYQIEELLEIVTFVGVKREGFPHTTTYPIMEVDVPFVDISSSMIRKRYQKGLDSSHFLPGLLGDFIKENQIYES